MPLVQLVSEGSHLVLLDNFHGGDQVVVLCLVLFLTFNPELLVDLSGISLSLYPQLDPQVFIFCVIVHPRKAKGQA